jgi:hypothetical protein
VRQPETFDGVLVKAAKDVLYVTAVATGGAVKLSQVLHELLWFHGQPGELLLERF